MGGLVEAGWNILVEPCDPEQIASMLLAILIIRVLLAPAALYGQGDAAIKILRHMIKMQ